MLGTVKLYEVRLSFGKNHDPNSCKAGWESTSFMRLSLLKAAQAMLFGPAKRKFGA
jgi:hypothetical protein